MSAFVIISVFVSSVLRELLETAIILNSSFIPFYSCIYPRVLVRIFMQIVTPA